MTGTGVVHGDQHGLDEGLLPPISHGVRLVGKAQVTNPSGAGLKQHLADLAAYGDYAFLTAYREPTCERTGAYVINLSDPRAPYGNDGLQEVGAYREPGSDFLDVMTHKIGDKNYLLVSDRNYGLYIFDI